MYARALLIPIAAFALSATGVSAFNDDVLKKAGLTNEQISAFETAHELQKEGNKDLARDILKEAGIDLQVIESMRKAFHEYKKTVHSAIDEAVKNDDFTAFKIAITDSPIADIVNTESDFVLFKEAHELRKQGEFKASRDIFKELGFDRDLNVSSAF